MGARMGGMPICGVVDLWVRSCHCLGRGISALLAHWAYELGNKEWHTTSMGCASKTTWRLVVWSTLHGGTGWPVFTSRLSWFVLCSCTEASWYEGKSSAESGNTWIRNKTMGSVRVFRNGEIRIEYFSYGERLWQTFSAMHTKKKKKKGMNHMFG